LLRGHLSNCLNGKMDNNNMDGINLTT
jgi:hypothetical protein